MVRRYWAMELRIFLPAWPAIRSYKWEQGAYVWTLLLFCCDCLAFICFLNAGVVRYQPAAPGGPRSSLPGRVDPARQTADWWCGLLFLFLFWCHWNQRDCVLLWNKIFVFLFGTCLRDKTESVKKLILEMAFRENLHTLSAALRLPKYKMMGSILFVSPIFGKSPS